MVDASNAEQLALDAYKTKFLKRLLEILGLPLCQSNDEALESIRGVLARDPSIQASMDDIINQAVDDIKNSSSGDDSMEWNSISDY